MPSWDLSNLYEAKKDSKISTDLGLLREKTRFFAQNYKDKIKHISPDDLAAAIAEYENTHELAGQLSSYAYLVYSTNIKEGQSFYSHISEKVNDIMAALIFFELELNALQDDKLQAMLISSDKLHYYKPWLDKIRMWRKYQFSREVEEVFFIKKVTSRDAWINLFDESITNLRFPWQGKSLNISKITDLFSSKNPEHRKEAALSLGKTLKENIGVFVAVINATAKDRAIDDKFRGFKTPISHRNLCNFVEDDVVSTLIDTVKANYGNLSQRYYKLKSKAFGKEKLDYWDRNAPWPGDEERYIPWHEAKEIVLSAYSGFSEEMAGIAKMAFEENWIDAKISDNKVSGAFSHPTVPSKHPYVLLNYSGKMRDVLTLAHELGHAIHQVFANKKGMIFSGQPLTFAETASIFGEQLTFRYLLGKMQDKKQRNLLIASKIEDMLNTSVRQIAICDFERRVHEARKKNMLDAEEIGEIWLAAQSESLGQAVNLFGDYRYFWAYIPHIVHSPFYVYAYAFGECLVNSLYEVYMNDSANFAARYINLLGNSGVMLHRELLSCFELSAYEKSFWQKGLNMIDRLIDEIE